MGSHCHLRLTLVSWTLACTISLTIGEDCTCTSSKFSSAHCGDSGEVSIGTLHGAAGVARMRHDDAVSSTAHPGREDAQSSYDEFKCPFHWNEKHLLKLKHKMLDWMKNRQKSIIRFTVPVRNYMNAGASLYNYTGLLVWVWVLSKYEYVLHYPQNFVRLSSGTMGIITEDWALDYDQNMSLSLGNFSFDIKNDNYEYEGKVGHCEVECFKANQSCGIGRQEIVKLLANVSESDSNAYAWKLVCLQPPYAYLEYHPNFGFPDVFYYMLFLEKLLVERTMAWTSEKTIVQYQCYERENLSLIKKKELLESYFVIPILALALWLYIPLFIFYFPSSATSAAPVGMFPSHESPNSVGKFLKTIFCYYTTDIIWIKLRQILCVFLILASPVGLFSVPYYGRLMCGLVIILVAATIANPHHISTYLDPSCRFTCLCWTVPAHLIQINTEKLVGYQLLAKVMQERVYLLVNGRFWGFLLEECCFNSFKSYLCAGTNLFNVGKVAVVKLLLLIWGSFLLILSAAFLVLDFLIPLFYFLREMARAVYHMSRALSRNSSSILVTTFCSAHGILVYLTFFIVLIVLYFWCYAFVEVSLFTLIGGAMLPKMAYPYFLLVGSIIGAMYTLVHSLHDDYENITEKIIKILDSETKIPKEVTPDLSNIEARELLKTESPIPSSYTISIATISGQEKQIMVRNFAITFLSKEMYDFVVDSCHPVRKQVLFIFLKVLAILFYASIVLWVKNVYHLEEEMDTIFNIVSIVAVAFVPSLLHFQPF